MIPKILPPDLIRGWEPVLGKDHKQANVTAAPAGLAGAYLSGLAFGFGWSPCTGPVLTTMLPIAGARQSAGEGGRQMPTIAYWLIETFQALGRIG